MSNIIIAFIFISLVAAFQLLQGFRILFIQEFKRLDASPDREAFDGESPAIDHIKLDDPDANKKRGNKTFYPFKASRAFKFSVLSALSSYLLVIYFLLENKSIFILWIAFFIAYIISLSLITLLGDFYTHIVWSEEVKQRQRSTGGIKDKRYKGGFKERPTYTGYYHRDRLYTGPNYVELFNKKINQSWIWIFLSSLLVPFM
jgi:hypothetical protein